jgi:hypothetical protein
LNLKKVGRRPAMAFKIFGATIVLSGIASLNLFKSGRLSRASDEVR